MGAAGGGAAGGGGGAAAAGAAAGGGGRRAARLVGERSALKGYGQGAAERKDDWGSYAKTNAPPLLGRSVVIGGLLARPELNGTRGVAASHNAETGRYNVSLPKGEVIALKPANLSVSGEGGEGGGGGGMGEAAKAAVEKAEAEKKASIGARMAAKRNAKGVGWAKKGIDGQTQGGLGGMFASEEKRQEVERRRAANNISEDYDPMAAPIPSGGGSPDNALAELGAELGDILNEGMGRPKIGSPLASVAN